MSIMIVRGPLSLRACGSEQELLDALRVAQQAGIEAAILDPGACTASVRLQRQMQVLDVPYVEVHGMEVHGRQQGHTPPRALAGDVAVPPCRIAEVEGYGAQGYLLALSIALDHLGCGEHVNPVHVGT